MRKLTPKEMKNIEGGVDWVKLTFTAGLISFMIGIIDGFINPKKCNN